MDPEMNGASADPEIPNVPNRIGGPAGDWRIERARLEQRHSEAVLRRKPRYGTFALSSGIVQRLGLSTKEEWIEWLEWGGKKGPYVPRDPEEYYGRRGSWLGWTIWLTGDGGSGERET